MRTKQISIEDRVRINRTHKDKCKTECFQEITYREAGGCSQAWRQAAFIVQQRNSRPREDYFYWLKYV